GRFSLRFFEQPFPLVKPHRFHANSSPFGDFSDRQMLHLSDSTVIIDPVPYYGVKSERLGDKAAATNMALSSATLWFVLVAAGLSAACSTIARIHLIAFSLLLRRSPQPEPVS